MLFITLEVSFGTDLKIIVNNVTAIKLQNENYKCGNYEKALEDSFIGFDATLVDRKVVAELKVIAGNSEDKVTYSFIL